MKGLYGQLLLPSVGALKFLKDFSAKQPAALPPEKEAMRTPIRYTYDGREFEGDLYTPARPIRAGMVLVPGVSKDGRDDPRLLSFARLLARAGFAVVVPELASVRELKVIPALSQDVVAAFDFLRSRPDLSPGGRAGIGGLSFAIGPGVLAALEPAIAADVRYLFCVGGYYNLFETVTFVTTGHHREPGGEWRYLTPDHYGRWVLALSLSIYLPQAGDRNLFTEMAARRVPDAKADIADLAAKLEDPGGRALLSMVLNEDREQVRTLYDALPAPMRAAFEALDFSKRDLADLRARLILVHGYDDSLIAYTQSVALHAAAPAGRKRLYLLNGLSHVTVEKPGLIDAWAMASAVTALLRELKA